MELDAKTYWLTNSQSQCDLEFDLQSVVEREAEWRRASAVKIECELS
jgi:hypothetical protein